jgi:hypothetical protein
MPTLLTIATVDVGSGTTVAVTLMELMSITGIAAVLPLAVTARMPNERPSKVVVRRLAPDAVPDCV